MTTTTHKAMSTSASHAPTATDETWRQVSVCICTRNRPDSLRKTLESIRGSVCAPHQVVVADDSTDPRTADLIRDEFPEVAYLTGPRRGLGANRNTAAAVATGGTILFLDDDCLLGPRFLSHALAALERWPNPDRAIVGGHEMKNGTLVVSADQCFLGFQNRVYGACAPIQTVVINAALFPRTMFDRLKFDERIVYGYDEVDLTSRAVAMGYEIILCPDAINHHFPSPVNRDYYGEHANSARLYVTFKRYRWTDRRPLKATAFLTVAIMHVFASMTKADGLAGLRAAPAVVREAVRSIRADDSIR
jgi:GT2 family glycosyltransferase